MADLSTHPALPEDRERHEELHRLLVPRLVLIPERTFAARGEFHWHTGDPGGRPDHVFWYDSDARRASRTPEGNVDDHG